MIIPLNSTQEQEIALIPEKGKGYHYVYIYLRGPIPSRQLFRFKTLVFGGQKMPWPVQIGQPKEYSFEKFTKI